jgi:hypothetical protein
MLIAVTRPISIGWSSPSNLVLNREEPHPGA